MSSSEFVQALDEMLDEVAAWDEDDQTESDSNPFGRRVGDVKR